MPTTPAPTLPQTSAIPELLYQSASGAVYRWLGRNGVTEWLPEDAQVVVDRAAATITYTAFRWLDGKRGFNPEYLVFDGPHPSTEVRTVPLIEVPHDRFAETVDLANRELASTRRRSKPLIFTDR